MMMIKNNTAPPITSAIPYAHPPGSLTAIQRANAQGIAQTVVAHYTEHETRKY